LPGRGWSCGGNRSVEEVRSRQGQLQLRILGQDRAFEALEVGARLDPQLADEAAPRRAVGAERLDLPA
jgi:hypothetical protein